jgi:hypothetical protein
VVGDRQTVGYLVVSDEWYPAYLWEEVSVTIFHASLGKAHQRLDPASYQRYYDGVRVYYNYLGTRGKVRSVTKSLLSWLASKGIYLLPTL